MQIIQKTNFELQKRGATEASLYMEYALDFSVPNKTAKFENTFNITQLNQPFTISLFFAHNSIGQTSTNSSTTFGTIFSKHTPVQYSGVWAFRGLVIGFRRNTGQSSVYGDPTKSLNNIRFELYGGDGTMNRFLTYTGFDYPPEKWYHLTVLATNPADITTYKLYINGIEQNQTTLLSDPITSITDTGKIYHVGFSNFDYGSSSLTSYGYTGWVNNLMGFDKVLNQSEIDSILKNGGNLQKNLHENIQFHFPFNHGRTNVALNIIEQYNAAKAIKLKPSHAELLNYTNDDVGLETDSSNKYWKEFYNKSKNFYSFHFKATNYYGSSVSHNDYFNAEPHNSWNVGVQDFEYFATFSCSTYSNIQLRPFYKPDVNWILFMITSLEGGSDKIIFEISWNSGANKGRIESTQSATELLVPNKIHTLGFIKLTNDANSWSLLLDGREIPFTVVSNTLGATVLNSTGSIRFWASTSSNFTLRAYETVFRVGGVLRGHWNWSNYSGGEVRDLSGHGNVAIRFDNNSNTPRLGYGGDIWMENKTLKPPNAFGLKFDRAKNQYLTISNFTPTSENGYTIVVGFKFRKDQLNSDYSDTLLAIRGTSSRYFLVYGYLNNGVPTFYVRFNEQPIVFTFDYPVNNPNLLICTVENEGSNHRQKYWLNGTLINDQVLSGPIQGFDVINNDLYIGTDPVNLSVRNYDEFIYETAIAKGIATEEQIKFMNNNQWHVKPRTDWTNLDWQLIVNYDKRPTATPYVLEDLSPQGRTITMNNFTANNVSFTDFEHSWKSLRNLRRYWTPYDDSQDFRLTTSEPTWTTSGTAITAFQDASFRKNPIAVSVNRPILETGSGGKPVFHFVRANSTHLRIPNAPHLSYGTSQFIFAVFKLDFTLMSGDTFGVVVSKRASYYLRRYSGNSQIIYSAVGILPATDAGPQDYTNNTYVMAACQLYEGTRRFRVNGSMSYEYVGTGSGDITDSTHDLIVAAEDGIGRYGELWLHELIVAEGKDLDTILKYEGWAAHEYGLTSALPVDHLYRINRPKA